jgi:heat shock protein HslJ
MTMNKQPIILILLTSVLITVLGACSSTASDPLDGTSWNMYAYRKTKPLPGTSITATFANGKISGDSGCNSYDGRYRVNGDKITISDLFNTLMSCPPKPEGIMEQEQFILETLEDAQTYQLSEGILLIFRTNGEALTFEPQE